MNDRVNSSDLPTTGVPASSLGVVLQRGGEELILEKALYRFTIRPHRLCYRLSSSTIISGYLGLFGSVVFPKHNWNLFTVAPNQLEEAMSQARADENVAFASHVYTIKDNPGTFVYLSDQITIQFASWVDTAKINAIATTFSLDPRSTSAWYS